MSARHQCEASTWRHDAHFATVVRGCCRGCRCRFRRPWSWRCWNRHLPVLVFVLAAVDVAAVVDPWVQGLRMSADRMADCTQKLQATISAAVESWQIGFNSLMVHHIRFFLGPTDVQPVAICLIWCRVVRSRDVRSIVEQRYTLRVVSKLPRHSGTCTKYEHSRTQCFPNSELSHVIAFSKT